MSLLDGYINFDGIVTAEKNAKAFPGDGNGILQTGLAVACGMMSEESAMAALNRCFGYGYPLFWRSPHKQNPDDDEKCDDYWGAFVFGSESWARDLLAYAEQNSWYFCVNKAKAGNIEYYFGRFAAFEPLLRIKAGQTLGFFGHAILALTVFYDSLLIDKADGNMKAFCRISVIEQAQGHTLAKIAAKFWRFRINRKYGYLGASWAAYFESCHPLSLFGKVNT